MFVYCDQESFYGVPHPIAPILKILESPKSLERCFARALIKGMGKQFITPNGNSAPFVGRTYEFLKRNISAPILKSIPRRPMTNDDNHFTVILPQNIAQKRFYPFDNHQQTLTVRERRCDTLWELFLYLSDRVLREISIVVFPKSRIWHDRHFT